MVVESGSTFDYYSPEEIDIDMLRFVKSHGTDKIEQQYVKIEVRNPRTHISREKALYTDYEILVETNNIAFASSESYVRRRYSDFQWLRNRIFSQFPIEHNLPELPPKRLFGRFKRQFLKHRQKGLQRFLEEVTNESTYLSDIAVHLFLQSSLSIKEIEKKLNSTDSGGELIEVLQSPSTSRDKGLSRSSSQVDGVDDMNLEHDSGFCYSTTSSINDYVGPNTPTHKVSTNGSCLATDFDIDVAVRSIPHQNKILERVKPRVHSDIYSHETFTSSSEDDFFFDRNYDADDEVDVYLHEENNNVKFCYPSSDDEEELFCFSRNSKQGTILSLDRALELIQNRPKLTDRLYSQLEDSDDCFHESEYDVIDSEEDLTLIDIVDDDSYPKATVPSVKVRSSSYTEGDMKASKNKLKTGKVKSLPNIRFPIRNKKHGSVSRSLTFHSMTDIPRKKLKEVKELDELTIPTSEKEVNKTDTIEDKYLSASKARRSESEGQQLTSDADYLTTIHKYPCSNDSHDTNVDTQAEDAEPLKFYDFFKKRSKKRSFPRLYPFNHNAQLIKTTTEAQTPTTTDLPKGRFKVSKVHTIPTKGDMLLNSVELCSSASETSPLRQNDNHDNSDTETDVINSVLEINGLSEHNNLLAHTDQKSREDTKILNLITNHTANHSKTNSG